MPISTVPLSRARAGEGFFIWTNRRPWTGESASGVGYFVRGAWNLVTCVEGCDVRAETVDAQFWCELPADPTADEIEGKSHEGKSHV